MHTKGGEKCRKLYMAGVPYSPLLVVHLNTINHWRILIHKKKGSCTNMRTIVRLQKSCGITGRPLDCGMDAMYARYEEVIYEYRMFRKTAATSIATFQDTRIGELALAGKVEASSIQNRIKNLKEARGRS